MQKALIIIGVVFGLGLFGYADGWRHLEGLFNAIGFVYVCALIIYGCWMAIQHFIINKINKRSNENMINKISNENIKTKKNSINRNDFKDYIG